MTVSFSFIYLVLSRFVFLFISLVLFFLIFFFCLLFHMFFFFFKQKTAYEMRISDWSSDVCSSDLRDTGEAERGRSDHRRGAQQRGLLDLSAARRAARIVRDARAFAGRGPRHQARARRRAGRRDRRQCRDAQPRRSRRASRFRLSPRNRRRKVPRSEEHTSELQSLMRISYAVFCLKKKKQKNK